MFNPLVSIIIPVYNGEDYICKAIDSAFAQTYENIEIIVVNDGSTDNTDEIVRLYGDKIRYFTKKNGGVSTALNLGIKNMRGEYFSWLSHDDVYHPEKVKKNVAAISGAKDRKRIVYSDFHQIDKDGERVNTVVIKDICPNADYEYWLTALAHGIIIGCALLIHKSQFKKYGLFDEKLLCAQDYHLFYKMFRNQKLIYINEPLFFSRLHDNQTTRTSERALLEGDVFWVLMLSSMSKRDISKISSSEAQYWSQTAPLMAAQPYEKAAAYASARLSKTHDMLKEAPTKVKKSCFNIPKRLYRAIKRHGIAGVWKIFWQRVTRH